MPHPRLLIGIISACCFAVVAPNTARGVDLYDGSAGTLPGEQGWLLFGADAAVTTHSAGASFTTLDTGAASTRAGWTNTIPFFNTLVNPAFPSLDRAAGFVLDFDLKLLSETHSSDDRAGLSVILLANDHQGIELGFWEDQVWAQSGPAFTHGEEFAYGTTAQTHYALSIQGSGYSLSANDTEILSGALRDYSSGLAIPYSLNNYLFIGDNTTSATAAFELSSLTITPLPEPSAALLAACILPLTRRRRMNRTHA